METFFSERTWLAGVMWFGILTPEPAAVAQTPAGLTIQTYAGLTITGEVGMVYSIECVTNLAETNVWVPLTNLMLAASPYLWMDTGSPATGRRYYRAVAVGEPTTPRVVPIPAGFFMMGSPSNEVDRWAGEGPQTAVTISRGFWMGKYKVTQGQYQAVMGTNPSSFTGDLSRPVEQVGWSDATNYCARLTQRERAAGRIASNSVYRLPTEAEWEYACRAGTSTRFSYGDDVGYTALASYAWYSANSGSSTHPVGQKLPNAWGLYDVHGNLWEWCLDWYGGYSGGSAIDPQGPSTGINRVIRGSPYNAPDRGCRSAVRSQNSGGPGNIFGLRVVLAPGQP